MALQRYTKSVDGTIPIQALMYNDEELISTQDGIGIYDGLQKSLDHQSGTVHITSQRLFYIDATKKAFRSFSLALSHVSKTDYYAGLFSSSPKVTLHLSIEDPASEEPSGFGSWECEVCAYRNPPGLSPSAARVCALCGVPRSLPAKSASSSASSEVPQPSIDSSFPTSASTSALPQRFRKPSSISCPACTFLNHPSMQTCEICSTPLPKASGDHTQAKSAPTTRPTTPGLNDNDIESKMLKLSFRKGGDKVFYTALKRSLKGRAWEITPSNAGTNGARSGICENTFLVDVITSDSLCLAGIMQAVENNAQNRDADMSNALQDLEALMVKAKDMVRLAAELNERLTASSTTTANDPYSSVLSSTLTEPEEATFIRSSLSQLGLQMENTPVTLDMMKDEREWMEQLARELANILQGSEKVSSSSSGGMMKKRGIIALDEVWGGWNRARGVALIPPSTFLQVIPHLPAFTNPTITSRTLNSGLAVLHTPPYSRAAFAARICGLLALAGPKSTTEIAQEEGITIGLTVEMLIIVEEDGDVCRDDGQSVIQEKKGDILVLGEVNWWANLFIGYTWDGQE
ncbi:EAP30/Vps36 family-domain-containing protein [Lentinula edodes]|nr:EAP30/Vps36 family-domain-containing protein [Lentinula edodes]